MAQLEMELFKQAMRIRKMDQQRAYQRREYALTGRANCPQLMDFSDLLVAAANCYDRAIRSGLGIAAAGRLARLGAPLHDDVFAQKHLWHLLQSTDPLCNGVARTCSL